MSDAPVIAVAQRPPAHSIDRPTQHIPALDSVRGLAAMTVVIHHLGLAYASLNGVDVHATLVWRMIDHWGHSAVIVFFVLSGFVLQVSYSRTKDFAYLPYLAKRIARVYPALLLAVLGSAVLHALVAPTPLPALGHWLNDNAEARHDVVTVIRHVLLLMMGPPDFALDNPIWSLAYEMRFSLIFPLMAWMVARRSAWFMAGISLLYLACIGWLWHRHELGPWMFGYGRIRALVITLLYLFCFGLGMAGSRWLAPPRRALSRGLELVLVAGALVVLSAVRDEVLSSIAALVLIACASAPESLTGRLAGQAWALWLGRISYSLYLLHTIILFYVLYALGAALPFALAAVLIVVLSLAAAHLSYRFVEQPGMRAGRRAAGRLVSA